MRMRLMYIVTGLSIGGAEVSLVEISTEALRLGHEVLIISLTNPSPDFIERFDKRIKILTINLRSKYCAILSLYKFSGIMRLYKPDMVHSHMIHANLFAALCKLIGIIKQPLIATAHSINEGRLSVFYRASKFLYNYTIHISNVGLNFYVEKGYFNKCRSLYIPNGISVPEMEFNNLDTPVEGRFITLGRLVKLKNHKLMIDSVIHARRHYPWVSLAIFGDGPCYAELEQYIFKNKAQSFIFLMGETSSPRRELLQSNYFLLSSDWEGMPMSLLEAAGVGLPCAVTDVGSCKEILIDLPLCFTATQGDTNEYYSNVMALAAAPLHSIKLAKPIIRDRIVSTYSISSTFQSMFNLYVTSINETF